MGTDELEQAYFESKNVFQHRGGGCGFCEIGVHIASTTLPEDYAPLTGIKKGFEGSLYGKGVSVLQSRPD